MASEGQQGVATSIRSLSITPSQRVREFPEEQLSVSAGKLFCQACREEVRTKISVLKSHIKMKKHADSTKRREAKGTRERNIAQAFVVYDESHPRGETLPTGRSAGLQGEGGNIVLRAGVPLINLECFRDILEENTYRLTDRRHMSDLVPFIRTEEQAKIKWEIGGKDVSAILDGTTRLGEAMAVVIRFVSDEWALEQRLLQLKMLAKSMTGEDSQRAHQCAFHKLQHWLKPTPSWNERQGLCK